MSFLILLFFKLYMLFIHEILNSLQGEQQQISRKGTGLILMNFLYVKRRIK